MGSEEKFELISNIPTIAMFLTWFYGSIPMAPFLLKTPGTFRLISQSKKHPLVAKNGFQYSQCTTGHQGPSFLLREGK